VNIVTNSFNAEQGMAGGAQVNVTIKGGQRDFHGSAWEYYQDAAINARAYTATAASLISALNPTGSVPKNVFDEFGATRFRVDEHCAQGLPPRLYRKLEPLRPGGPRRLLCHERWLCRHPSDATAGRVYAERRTAAQRLDHLHGERAI
jgi:hypothetical protein